MSIPPWNRKKTLSTRAHQEIIDQVNKNSEIDGTGDLYRGEDGRTIVDRRGEIYFLRALAVIIEPEDLDHTYDDPRYRCQLQKIIEGQLPEDLVKLDTQDDIQEQYEGATAPNDSEETPIGWTVTATNLAEITDPLSGAGSHDLPEDGTVAVEIFARRSYVGVDGDDTTVEIIRWMFNSGGIMEKGEYQGMFPQMVTQNEVGYDFDELHSPAV